VSQQIWQLGDIRRDAPGLVTREQLGRRAPAGLVLKIDVSEHLLVGVTDDDAGVLFDAPAAICTAQIIR